MKKKLMILSVIILTSIISIESTMAWFTSSKTQTLEKLNIGTVNVEVIESSINNIRVKNTGTSKTYVRAMLVPQWGDSNLSTSNIRVDYNLSDWELSNDGYYYFKYYLDRDQITSSLLHGVEFNDLVPEYEGKIFNLKVVSEGVQISNEYWRVLWGIDNLPFTPEQPWTP